MHLIYYLEPDDVNIALGKPATQSSLSSSGSASNAVDGSRDGNYFHYSCTHTQTEDFPWWRLDLGGAHRVTKVCKDLRETENACSRLIVPLQTRT